MQQPVLRQRLQRRETATRRKMQMQVSLVLLRAMSELYRRGMDHGLQVNELVGIYLALSMIETWTGSNYQRIQFRVQFYYNFDRCLVVKNLYVSL